MDSMDSMAGNRQTIGYLELIRTNRNFKYLWFGQIVSLLGDWFNLIASAALIAQLTGSGLAIGGLFIVRWLAPFFVSPIAGVLADRYNRRNILILTDIGRAVTVLGFLFIHNEQFLWLLYVLTAVQLGISGVFFPTRNAILPDIVEERAIGTANAITSATWSVMLAVGAALGGMSAGYFGIYPSFMIDSATFVISALIIARIKIPPCSAKEDGACIERKGSFLTEYREGIQYLLCHRDILVITLIKPLAFFTAIGGLQVLQVMIADQVFPIGKASGFSLGFMFMMVGMGTGISPFIARKWTGDEESRLRKTIVLGFVLVAVAMSVIATLKSFPIILCGLLIEGLGSGIIWVFSTQLLLSLTDETVRGRVFSTEFAFLTLANAISAACVGFLTDFPSLGIQWTAFIMSLAVLIPGLLWYTWIRSLKWKR